MGDKSKEYSRLVGPFHLAKESVKESWSKIKDGEVQTKAKEFKENVIKKINQNDEQFDHLYRRKTRRELVKISAAVMGIEFSYAAETAFVSPTLLKIGVQHQHMTLIWCLSPLMGFFLTPIMGSLSDRCKSSLGRRRPFILILSVGVIIGLLLVPNGKWLGKKMGDRYPLEDGPRAPLSKSDKKFLAYDELEGPGGRLAGREGTFDNKTIRLKQGYSEGPGGGDSDDDAEEMPANWKVPVTESYKGVRFLRKSATKKAKKRLDKDDFDADADPESPSNGTDPDIGRIDSDLGVFGKSVEDDDNDDDNDDEEAKQDDDVDDDERAERPEEDEIEEVMDLLNEFEQQDRQASSQHHHPWGIFFTVLGTVLLDFDADACQSPSRAYLLDVTVADDHAKGLSTFTVMAGLGGSLGYALGGLDWGRLGVWFGGHVRLVFFLVLFIYMGCVYVTMTSFPEMPLEVLENAVVKDARRTSCYSSFIPDDDEKANSHEMNGKDYGAIVEAGHPSDAALTADGDPNWKSNNPFKANQAGISTSKSAVNSNCTEPPHYPPTQIRPVNETSFSVASPMPLEEGELSAKASLATVTQYLWSIVYMPNSMRVLCLTNFFCWMSLVCYSLYFTDFVGEAVFGGNPQADPGTKERQLYDDGVRFGCWGMSMYSLSCSCYSFIIEKLVKRFRAKPVYVGGQLVYSVGMVLLALIRTKWGVLLFSWSAGIMYSTLFTMPYIIVAHYHETNIYSEGEGKVGDGQVRGIGTDVGIVSSMVFLAQFILSFSMGTFINYFQTTTVIVVAASVLSFCGAVSASFITYLDL